MAADALRSALNEPVLKGLIATLGFDLCEKRGLPAEIASLVSCHFDRRDILTISTLSQNLHERASAVLYYHVVIDPSSSANWKNTAVLLLRSLVISKTAASYIRRLSLAGAPLHQCRSDTISDYEGFEAALDSHLVEQICLDLRPFQPQELEQYSARATSHNTLNTKSITDLTLPWLCIDIISLATHLQELSIISDYLRYDEFRMALSGLIHSGNLKSLQKSNFCTDLVHGSSRHMKASHQWDNSLLAPFFAPSIDSISAVMTLSAESISQLRPSTVTRLSLDHYQMQAFELKGLLAATPRLCHLEYNAWVDWSWYTGLKLPDKRLIAGLEPLFQALSHVEDTLTELITTINVTEDSRHFDPSYVAGHKPLFKQSNGVSQLKHLHTLSVPWTYLLGDTQKDEPIKDWNLILPPSLRQITWTDHLNNTFSEDDWTDEHLMPVISTLLPWLKRVGSPHDISKFGLLLHASPTEFNSPVRQALFELCESSDVSCSIQKNTRDLPKPSFVGMPRGRGTGRRVGSHMSRGGNRGLVL